KTSIFSHPVYLFLRKFSLQDSRGGSNSLYLSDNPSLVII
ncbi:integrase, partial (plasmid) [Escherichia coli]